jgi:isopentenyldiphosphate isomerase
MIDRKELIKNFTISFLPLLVFIIADEFFGLTIGLAVAISFGLMQSIVTFLREKKIERFILFDTGLILILGLISLVLQNDVFFKIKPGLIGLILVALLGISAFSDNPLFIKLFSRYFKDINFSSDQIKMMQVMMKRMFYLFACHTILIFYSAFYMSKEGWAFISGGLFYILIAAIFLFEFIKAFWQKYQLKKKYQTEEWFDIVNPDGKIIGRAPRSAVHGNPDLLHPVVHIHIINSKGEIFLQKRSKDKDIQPSKWDTAVGGHIQSGETMDHALRRETEEEMGISFAKFKPFFRYVMRNEIESELIHGFLIEEEGPFYPNPNEIIEARFWKSSEIEEALGTGIFTPNFEKEYELLLKIYFKQR